MATEETKVTQDTVEEKNVNETANNGDLIISLNDNVPFEPISDSKYLSSQEFLATVSDIFRKIYADYEGCTLEMIPSSSALQIKMFFNHNDYSNSNLYVACSKEATVNAKSEAIAMIRRHSYQVNNGDRYYLTDDGKSGLRPFFVDWNALYGKNNDLNWAKIVADVSDNASQNQFAPLRQQYTQVSFIDPAKIAALIYGDGSDKDPSGNPAWIYNVRILHSIPSLSFGTSNNNPNSWMLAIDRVSPKEVQALAARYGLNMSSGLNIIR